MKMKRVRYYKIEVINSGKQNFEKAESIKN